MNVIFLLRSAFMDDNVSEINLYIQTINDKPAETTIAYQPNTMDDVQLFMEAHGFNELRMASARMSNKTLNVYCNAY